MSPVGDSLDSSWLLDSSFLPPSPPCAVGSPLSWKQTLFSVVLGFDMDHLPRANPIPSHLHLPWNEGYFLLLQLSAHVWHTEAVLPELLVHSILEFPVWYSWIFPVAVEFKFFQNRLLFHFYHESTFASSFSFFPIWPVKLVRSPQGYWIWWTSSQWSS